MGKQRLVENFIVGPRIREIKKIQEANKVVELEGTRYQCIAAFTFPISRPGKKNLNNRVYGYALWDRVIRLRQGERKFGVCDHPADDSEQPDGSVLKTFCVWRNMRYSEDKKLVLMDCYVFGDQTGKHFVDAIRAGGLPGFSSVGYGDFLEDGIEIDPETYELDRPADWVMNPSYEVFGSIEDEIQTTDADSDHRIERAEVVAREDAGASIKTRLTEERSMGKIEERSYRLQIRGLRKEADAHPSVFGRLEAYRKILPYLEGDDAITASLVEERRDILGEIDKLEESMRSLAEKGEQFDAEVARAGKLQNEMADRQMGLTSELEAIKKENIELAKRLDRALNLADGLKTYSKKLKEMHDTAVTELDTRFTASEYNEMSAFATRLEKENLALKKAGLREGNQFLGGDRPRVSMVGQRRREDELEPAYEEPEEDIEEADHELPDWSDEHDIHGDLQVDTRPTIISEPDEAPFAPVTEYYRDLVQKNPRIREIRKEILETKSVSEAQRVYARLKDLIEAAPKKRDQHRVTSRVINKYRHRRSESEGSEDRRLSGEGDLPLRDGWR